MQNIILENPWIIAAVILWSFPWKGVALWRSARRGKTGWFVTLLFFNTLAILDILYIFIFDKTGVEKKPKTAPEQMNLPNQPEKDEHRKVYLPQNNKFIV